MAHPKLADVLITPVGLPVLAELNRRGYSLDSPPLDEVFDQVLAEVRAGPAAETVFAMSARRSGGSWRGRPRPRVLRRTEII